jgi:hypothetical protein
MPIMDLAVYLITTAITPRKIIAGIILLIIIVAIGVWWARRRRPSP